MCAASDPFQLVAGQVFGHELLHLDLEQLPKGPKATSATLGLKAQSFTVRFRAHFS